MTTTWFVFPHNLPAAEKRLARAVAAGAITGWEKAEEVLDARRLTAIDTPYGKEWNTAYTWPVEVVRIMVSPTPIHGIDSWQIIARRSGELVEWLTEEFRTSAESRATIRARWAAHASDCQACGKAIQRKETLVLKRGDEILQVGGQCAGYYIPARTAKVMAELSAILIYLDNTQTEDLDRIGQGRVPANWLCANLVVADGWLHKNEAFIPSRNRYGERNPDATWRQVADRVEMYQMGTLPAPDAPLTEAWAHIEAVDPALAQRAKENNGWVSIRDTAALVASLHRAAPTTVATEMPPTGRGKITGIILGFKLQESDWGVTTKALVDCGAYKLFGSVPGWADWHIGDRVEFTATISPKEAGFGFYSRPTR